MGVLFDYFAASDDAVAATVIDVVGGPAEAAFPTFALKGVDPLVQLGTLESLLTGTDYDTVVGRDIAPVAMAGGGERLVIAVSGDLVAALSTADDARLREVAEPWSRTEEFGGNADPSDLATALSGLAELARAATTRGDRLYCWICL
jgi:antitoxin (DNA-binding transcriptional repressor) of toxin-antitoxin stability system